MEKTFNEELNDMALDIEKSRAGAAKRLQNQKRLLLIGLIVMFCAIILGPKISKYVAEQDKWNSEHRPSIAIIFAEYNYLNGVAAIRKIDKPYHQCACAACRFTDKINDKWERQEMFVVTEAAEKLLLKTGLRYQRKDIGYNEACYFDSYDVASTSFVNW